MDDTNGWRGMQIATDTGIGVGSSSRTINPSSSSRIIHPSSENSSSLESLMAYRSPKFTRANAQIALLSLLLCATLAGAGVASLRAFSNSINQKFYFEALELAEQTGEFFAKELDNAILPLFSIAQFALELDNFSTLPSQIGQANEPGSLPFIALNGTASTSHRNITGVCDNVDLIAKYNHIAHTFKTNANMDGILHNIQLAPFGVICLVYPINNTEDFATSNGIQFLDSSKALGLDLLNDPVSKFIAQSSMKKATVGIAGPRPLTQCPTCGNYFIARLPIFSETNTIVLDGEPFPRWGFATALIHWDELVARSMLYETFQNRSFEFQLTRTDRTFNETTSSYDVAVVVLAESSNFGSKPKQVATLLQTTNNEWNFVVQYDDPNAYHFILIAITIFVSCSIAMLVGVVLVQKNVHAEMKGLAMAQDAKVEVERNMTAYFAHELRNPLFAIDCALQTLPTEHLVDETRDAIVGMQLCCTFMSSIMNNLLDVRKMEEGKLILNADPFSLHQLVGDSRRMALPTMNPGVELHVETSNDDSKWVIGDEPRIQQILTNLISNAIKYTKQGSVTISALWEGNLVRLEVRDTGPGIPKDDHLQMFDRFTQRGGGATGSGLGLAISKQLVTLMGGTMHFQSDPTVKPGTTCIVMLPLQPCEQSQEMAPVPNDVHLIEEPLSILIVDDSKINREMLKRRFQKGIAPNCIVTDAINGEQALEICEEETFDIIVVDQYMEETGGVMVGTDAIIAMRRLGVKSVIVGCSGNDLEAKFFHAGADLVWTKPTPSNVDIIRQLRQKISRRQSMLRRETIVPIPAVNGKTILPL